MATKTTTKTQQTPDAASQAAEQAKEVAKALAATKREEEKARKAAERAKNAEQKAKDDAALKAAKEEEAAKKKAERDAKNAPKPCGCGCGAQAKNGSRFLPGHDARFYAEVKRVVEGETPLADAPEAVRVAAEAGDFKTTGSFRPRWNALKGEAAPVTPRTTDRAKLEKRVSDTRTLLAQLEKELAALPA